MKRFNILMITVFILAFVLGPSPTEAAGECSFTRDLELGMEGEDVRCLQRYLNGAGFQVSATGVGSPGRETNQYQTKTEAAVIAWQKANNLSPAIGYFGPLSRGKYIELNNPEVKQIINSLNNVGNTTPKPVVASAVVDNGSQRRAGNEIQKLLDFLDDTIEQIEEEDVSYDESFEAYEEMGHGLPDLIKAVEAYLDGNFSRVEGLVENAMDDFEESFEEAGGESVEDEADDLIDDLQWLLKDVKNQIRRADDEDDADDAEEIWEDAEDMYQDARDAYDDDDFDRALDLAEEAEELLDEALDEIGEGDDRSEARSALEDAEEEIEDVEEKIEEAEDDGYDVDDAEDKLAEAKRKLKQAQNEFDQDDFNDALEKAEDALDLAKDAEDQL